MFVAEAFAADVAQSRKGWTVLQKSLNELN